MKRILLIVSCFSLLGVGIEDLIAMSSSCTEETTATTQAELPLFKSYKIESVDQLNEFMGRTSPQQLNKLDIHLADIVAKEHIKNAITEILDKCDSTLKMLDIGGNFLDAFLNTFKLERFKELNSLNLRGNQGIFIGNWLGQLTKLEYLNLRNTKLSQIPRGLENLQNLKYLNLSHNKLTDLSGDVIEKLSALEELNLSDNANLKLPIEALSRLHHLKVIRLFKTGIKEEDLPENIRRIANFEEQDSSVTMTPIDLEDICSEAPVYERDEYGDLYEI